MLDSHRVLKQDRRLRALTGLNRKAFDELVTSFGTVYQQTLAIPATPRKRTFKGGRKAR